MIGPRRAVSLTWAVKGWVLRRATRARLVARRLRVSQAVFIAFNDDEIFSYSEVSISGINVGALGFRFGVERLAPYLKST
jgi:hypothetical protein